METNEKIIHQFDGELKIYYSSDSIISEDAKDVNNYSVEFLHVQAPSGVPHILKLKRGTIVILIRNLNPKMGLCNGTKMIVRDLHDRFISCEIIAESHRGDLVFVSRIDIAPSDSNLPFILKRRQFPVIPAFAVTINNAQGQTYDYVGIDLPEPVFSHGQLYVALSRTRTANNIKIKIKESFAQGRILKNNDWFTKNIVFEELFS